MGTSSTYSINTLLISDRYRIHIVFPTYCNVSSKSMAYHTSHPRCRINFVLWLASGITLTCKLISSIDSTSSAKECMSLADCSDEPKRLILSRVDAEAGAIDGEWGWLTWAQPHLNETALRHVYRFVNTISDNNAFKAIPVSSASLSFSRHW